MLSESPSYIRQLSAEHGFGQPYDRDARAVVRLIAEDANRVASDVAAMGGALEGEVGLIRAQPAK
jgi:hypothetical protein